MLQIVCKVEKYDYLYITIAMKLLKKLSKMNTNQLTRKEATRIANEILGKSAQSSVLTMISDCGQHKIPEPQQKITGYEIIDGLGCCELMMIVGGEAVLYETLFNIS